VWDTRKLSSRRRGEEEGKRMEMAGCKKNGVIMAFINTMIIRKAHCLAVAAKI
jgi:hypothetical protein